MLVLAIHHGGSSSLQVFLCDIGAWVEINDAILLCDVAQVRMADFASAQFHFLTA